MRFNEPINPLTVNAQTIQVSGGGQTVVASSLSAGGHTLVDLGPMDMGSVVTGDLLALFGGTVGGLLSGKK